MSFSVTLPSNASYKIFPENTPSHFRVLLPKPLHLTGKWKCGLSEIHFPGSWKNLVENDFSFNLKTVDTTPYEERSKIIKVELRKGERLAEAINSAIPVLFKTKFHIQVQQEDLPEIYSVKLRIAPGYEVFLPKYLEQYLKIYSDKDGIIRTSTSGHAMLTQYELDHAFEVIQDLLLKNGRKSPTTTGEKKRLARSLSHPDDLPTELREELPKPFNVGGKHVFFVGIYRVPNYGQIKKTIKIDAGFYETTQSLLENMRVKIRQELYNARIAVSHLPEFTVLPDHRIRISLPQNVQLSFARTHPGLARLLGFKDDILGPFHQTQLEGSYRADITNGIHAIYVYTDIVQSQIVGDTMAPLLRVVPIQTEKVKRSVISRIYDNPDMFDLTTNEISSIEIVLASDAGQKLEFLLGKSVIKLAFQKVG